ncbi:MAG: hypothetical protein HC808_12665 [Candidatus Competibacteraceae bacterium]|nr:hypothetical protein [Candidatus Competibacteraceae bacterium]
MNTIAITTTINMEIIAEMEALVRIAMSSATTISVSVIAAGISRKNGLGNDTVISIGNCVGIAE